MVFKSVLCIVLFSSLLTLSACENLPKPPGVPAIPEIPDDSDPDSPQVPNVPD